MSKKVKILIVEDEFLIASHLKIILENLGYQPYEVIGTKEEALKFLKTNQPDIAILDINLHGSHDGIEIGRFIDENYNFPFIYLTSNSDKKTVNVAKETSPTAYLVKPFTEDEIFATIEVALVNYTSLKENDQAKSELSIFQDAIFVRQQNKLVKLNIVDITHLQVTDKYIDLYIKKGTKYTVRSSMDAILECFKAFPFKRTHRSYAVNLTYLEEINGECVRVYGVEVPIGRIFRKDLVKSINSF